MEQGHLITRIEKRRRKKKQKEEHQGQYYDKGQEEKRKNVIENRRKTRGTDHLMRIIQEQNHKTVRIS